MWGEIKKRREMIVEWNDSDVKWFRSQTIRREMNQGELIWVEMVFGLKWYPGETIPNFLLNTIKTIEWNSSIFIWSKTASY